MEQCGKVLCETVQRSLVGREVCGGLWASREETQDEWIAEAGTHMATLAKTASCADDSWKKMQKWAAT